MKTLEALGGISGIIVLFTALVVVGKGIFEQVRVTKDNTEALGKLSGKIDKLGAGFDEHEIRLAVVEDRTTR